MEGRNINELYYTIKPNKKKLLTHSESQHAQINTLSKARLVLPSKHKINEIRSHIHTGNQASPLTPRAPPPSKLARIPTSHRRSYRQKVPLAIGPIVSPYLQYDIGGYFV